MNPTLADALARLATGESLDMASAEAVMDQIMAGEATPAQIAGVVMAMRVRGETAAEVSGFARSMRRHARAVVVDRRPLLDTCGTGGDGSHSFNISTAAAFVVAGAGVTVAKHGNRGASSKSGSADLLEALKVSLTPDPELFQVMISEAGFGFIFAQSVHPALRHAGPVRRELGVRTIFNVLGPLTNPASPEHQVIGVFDREWIGLVAAALVELDIDQAIVVHGDGLDEVTLSGTSEYARVDRGVITFGIWTPEDFGLMAHPKGAIVGGEARVNAEICLRLLRGEPGPYRDVVLANAAVALWAARKVDNVRQGVELAQQALDSGRALSVLTRLQQLSRGASSAD